MIQLLLHLIGDFLIQNNWMALNKKNKGWGGTLACFTHCTTYALPFLFVGSPFQVFLIGLTHYIIDRWHLIDWYIAIHNFRTNTENFGYGDGRPVFLTLWLNIIVDNTFHLILNYLILTYTPAAVIL